MALGLALPSCGGNVVVDGAGGAGAGTQTTATDTTFVTTTISTISTTTVIGDCSPTCDGALNDGPPPCEPSMAYISLILCGCATGSPCQTSCGANFCLHSPVSSPCLACMMSACGGVLAACSSS